MVIMECAHLVLYFDYVVLHTWMLSAVYEHCTIGSVYSKIMIILKL